ncbi:MAG: anti-sigma factor [Cyanobacteriota bacterium]
MTGPLLPERIEELMAGFVLGNLSSEEAEEFTQLLTEHPELEIEVQRLQEILEVMPYALPEVAPPPNLRQSILDTALAESQADALTAPEPLSASKKPNRALWRRLKGSPRQWTGIICGAASLLVLALALENYQIRLQVSKMQAKVARLASDNYQISRQVETMQAKVARREDVISMLQQPDVDVVPLKGMEQASAASGSMLTTPGESNAILVLKNLPVLPEGQFYQLWSVVKEEKILWGGFTINDHGTVFVKLPRPSNPDVTALVMTVEESPTPETPAGPMVMAGNLQPNN